MREVIFNITAAIIFVCILLAPILWIGFGLWFGTHNYAMTPFESEMLWFLYGIVWFVIFVAIMLGL